MKIELKIDDATTMILSDNELDNENYIEMWFENYDMDEDGKFTIKKPDYPDFEPLIVPIDGLMRALSALYKIKRYED